MKLVRESLLEFHQTGDPLGSLDLGFKFHTVEELADFIMSVLPEIFNGKIPDDILINSEGMPNKFIKIKGIYYDKIINFLNSINLKLVSDDNGKIDYNIGYLNISKDINGNYWKNWYNIIIGILLNMGFKEELK